VSENIVVDEQSTILELPIRNADSHPGWLAIKSPLSATASDVSAPVEIIRSEESVVSEPPATMSELIPTIRDSRFS
jgi:hypothetical protein